MPPNPHYHRDMRARIFLSLALTASMGWSAQMNTLPGETRPLSLAECVNLALQHNFDLQIQYLSADIARYNLSSSQGFWAPTLSVTAGRNYVSMPGSFDPQKNNPDYPYELTQDKVSALLSGQLPVGLGYTLATTTGFEKARTDFRSDPGLSTYYAGGLRDTNDYFAETSLTLRQHLLKDFWIDQERQTILIRRKDLTISQESIRFQMMKTVMAVALAYYDLSASKERIRVQEKALELRQQLLTETRRRVQVGDLPPLDERQAETQLQNTMTAIAVARENFAASQNTLKPLLTDKFLDWVDVEIEPSDVLLAIPSAANRATSFQSAMDNRPDLAQARIAVEKQDVVIRFRKNQLLPSLDLVGKYGGLGVDTAWSDTYNDANSFRDPEYYYGVVLALPLSNRSQRSDYEASKAAREVARLQLKQAEQGVLVQVANLVNQIQSRYEQVVSTRKARVFAEEALAAEEKKLANGLSTAFIVLQLQETLTSARVTEVEAIVSHNKAVVQLAFADGTILEKHHLNAMIK